LGHNHNSDGELEPEFGAGDKVELSKNWGFSDVLYCDFVKPGGKDPVWFQPSPGTELPIWNRCCHYLIGKTLGKILPHVQEDGMIELEDLKAHIQLVEAAF